MSRISGTILFTQEIKTFIVDFSFFIKGSFIHIIKSRLVEQSLYRDFE